MIINSLLDSDLYKFTMANAIYQFKNFDQLEIKYTFTNRNKNIQFGKIIDIDWLKQEINHVFSLTFTESDLDYLLKLTAYSYIDNSEYYIFKHDFIDFLKNFKMSSDCIDIYQYGKNEEYLALTFKGPWIKTIFYEVPILAIISQLYSQHILSLLTSDGEDYLYTYGKKILDEKIKRIKNNRSIRFSDFGTRRRFSYLWQDYVIKRLIENLHTNNSSDTYQFSGTSNVYFARKYNLTPIGTFAHELPMILTGKNNNNPITGYKDTMDVWKDAYKNTLSICLPDTYTTDFFLKHHSFKWAHNWYGIRHDSGDPIAFGEKIINKLKSYDIDPMTKCIVFSDSLDFDRIEKILEHFRGRIWCAFGIGTNLTNDLGIKPPNIVIKASDILSKRTQDTLNLPLVKLSDIDNKHTGDLSTIKRIKNFISTF